MTRLSTNPHASALGAARHVEALRSDGRAFAFCGLLICVMLGCDSPSTLIEPSLSYGQRMRQAANDGDWDRAWGYSDQVLIESGGEPATLELVAEVAFKTGRKSLAADLLVEAARAEGLDHSARFQTAFSGLLSAGRLFEALDLLREGVLAKPADNDRRRLLFNLLVATEQHREASKHRQILIRNRAFDGELLFSADRYHKRDEEVDSLAVMLERNPDDVRPLIGKAKRLFDERQYEAAIATLQRIVAGHPDFLTAQAMLGRAIVASGESSRLSDWAAGLPESIADHPDFWLILGDWAAQQDEVPWAMNAYGHAAKLGTVRVEAWNKLASFLAFQSLHSDDFALVKQRASSLTKLRQGYAEFKDRGKQSPTAIRQIARVLVDLGRLWEAEAWVAFGMTLPSLSESERRSLGQLRDQVVAQLRADTPWQSPATIPSWTWLKPLSSSTLIAELSGNRDSHPPMSNTASATASGPLPMTARPVLPRLSDEAAERGLNFFGRTADDLAEPGILNHQMIGCGGGAIDFDHDGWPDLYLVTAGGMPPHDDSAANAMFRNLKGHFENVSSRSGGEDRGFGQGVAVGDVNEDGFDDLLVLNYGPNRMWINNGDGTFSDQTDRWLPAHSVWSTSAAIADLNGDGICDAYIANYCAGLEPTFEVCRGGDRREARACSPNSFQAEHDTVLQGAPDGRFMDVTESWNVTPELLGRGLGIVAGSLDERPGIDLLVANDMTPNHYWTPRRSRSANDPFRLEESAALRGLATDGQSQSQGSMGIAVADLNGDRVADFYVTNFENEHNTLHFSRGKIGWNDQTSHEGLLDLTLPMVGFGTQAVDLDNNGQCELIVTNGHIDHIPNESGTAFYQQPAQIFQRNLQDRFESVAAQIESSYLRANHVGRGLWTIDANRDGKVDVAITHQTEPTALLINRTPSEHSSIAIRLVARQDSRTAVGSRVTVRSKSGETTHLHTSGDGFLCSNERCVRAGTGDERSAVDVTVRWPGGQVQTWTTLEVNREWLLVQDEPEYLMDTW